MQNLVSLSICLFVLKIWSKNQILTPIKGGNFVANLQKIAHYNPNVALVNGNVYTKFGLNPSIHSQDIEPKPNYAGMTQRENDRENDRITDRVNPV